MWFRGCDATAFDTSNSTDCHDMCAVHADHLCLNEPLIGLLNSKDGPSDQQFSSPLDAAPVFEPASRALSGGMNMTWARLVPFGLPEESLQQLLHRSHHAMVHVETAEVSDQAAPKLFLLWGGYGEYMSALNDMWAVYIYEPGTCTALADAAPTWWSEAWCFTALQIRQTGAVPHGRAYAKMAVLQVCTSRPPALLAGRLRSGHLSHCSAAYAGAQGSATARWLSGLLRRLGH